MAATHSILKVSGISKQYQGKQAAGIKQTDLNISRGRITAIIGESGSGKTTLLRLIYGLLAPDEGKVEFKGDRVWGPDEKLIPGHDDMKMVTQHTDDLNLHARVVDNVASMLPNTNLQSKQEKTERALEQLRMLHLADRRIVDLSGGEKQRVAIARALVTQPEVLLLDEPFNQVDASFREGLQQDIRAVVQETGLTVIIVSHDPAEVLSMADELLVLKDGQVIETGEPGEIYRQPKNLYTARLLTNCNVFTSEEATGLNINSNGKEVVIYPEWIETIHSITPKRWKVVKVLFKGFYEQVTVTNGNGLNLNLLSYAVGRYEEGDAFNLKINRYLMFEQITG